MKKPPDLQQMPPLPSEIMSAALSCNLVLFVGAGTSMLLGLPGWSDLAWQQLQALQGHGLLNYSEIEQLSTLDAKKQLSIAIQLAGANNIKLDLTTCFKTADKKSDIYTQLNSIGCPCVTTNYDEFLDPRNTSPASNGSTPITSQRFFAKDELLARHLDTLGTVVHLHGAISDPKSMVVTTKDYLEHYDDPYVQDFLAHLFQRKTVLFIGYGLEEAEILEHILRRGDTKNTGNQSVRKRFLLQGYFASQKPLHDSLHEYYLSSFGVHLIGFIRDHKDYHQQEDIIRDWATRIIVKPAPLASDLDLMNEVLGND